MKLLEEAFRVSSEAELMALPGVVTVRRHIRTWRWPWSKDFGAGGGQAIRLTQPLVLECRVELSRDTCIVIDSVPVELRGCVRGNIASALITVRNAAVVIDCQIVNDGSGPGLSAASISMLESLSRSRIRSAAARSF